MQEKLSLASLYVGFAVIATIANLAAQETVYQQNFDFYKLEISIFMGTLVGLLIKYLLDKKYIFHFHVESHSKNAATFILYSLMGIVTTVIFWVTEYAFDYFFQTKFMRYTGAVIGLAMGYVIKYHLDKKNVFVDSAT